MKKSILSTGVVVILLSLAFYVLDPYTAPETIPHGTRRFSLGEPPDNSVKSTEIDEWLGDYGGGYQFSLLVERVGDVVDVDVYVDGALVDEFTEVYRVDEKAYEGEERVTVTITAVDYSGLYGKSLYFDYTATLRRYGGYLYPRTYPLFFLPVGGLLVALGLVVGKKVPRKL